MEATSRTNLFFISFLLVAILIGLLSHFLVSPILLCNRSTSVSPVNRANSLNNYLTGPDHDFQLTYCADALPNGEPGSFTPTTRILKHATRNMLLLDVGGHFGLTSFPVTSCLLLTHRVITVEPVEFNQAKLKETASRLGIPHPSFIWQLIPAAFSNDTRNGTIFVPVNATDNASVGRSASTYRVGGSANSQKVRFVRGDDIILDAGIRPDIIKLDVQGAELMAMEGMDTLLSEHRDMVVIVENDSSFSDLLGMGPFETFDFMVDRGFRAFCEPDVKVMDHVFYPTRYDRELTKETRRTEVFPCADYFFFKNVHPHPVDSR